MPPKWVTESIRVSLFSSADTRITDADWEKIAGQTEDYNRQAVAGGFVYSGGFEDSQLTLSGQNRRVDIVQSVKVPAELPSSLLSIGPWERARDRFVEVVSTWIEQSTFPVARVAFGAVLLCPTDTREASYNTLKDLLSSVSVDTEGMRDLSFRINWPTQSQVVQKLKVNRITNWSALSYRFARVELGPSPTTISTPMSQAVRLELDHSTDQERSDNLDPRHVIPVFKELVALGSLNADRGERP